MIASTAPVVCVALPILTVSVPASTNNKLATVSPFTAKFTSASAELMLTIPPPASVISSPEITMLPNLPDVAITLPALTLPVALINPPVIMFPPVTLAVALTVVASTLPINV